MQISSKLLSVVMSLALPVTACLTSTSTTGSTSEPLVGDGGVDCCASIAATTVPTCKGPDDCCSGICGDKNLCTCAPSNGYCNLDSDCCSGTAGACSHSTATSTGIGHCQ
jgi:hypothetical protein